MRGRVSSSARHICREGIPRLLLIDWRVSASDKLFVFFKFMAIGVELYLPEWSQFWKSPSRPVRLCNDRREQLVVA